MGICAIQTESGAGYGFGWLTSAEDHSVFHTGSWSGTATSYTRYWKDDVSLVILSNNETTDVDNLAELIEEAVEAG